MEFGNIPFSHSILKELKDRKMKTFIRDFVGFIVVGPFMLSIKILSLFLNRGKAITIMSPLIVKVAKIFVRFVVPKIRNAAEFDKLTVTITKRLRNLRLFYDVTIAEKNENPLKLHITNCPFAEMAARLGYPDPGPFICQGDWEVAKDNVDNFIFERAHQIGTGDSFCDHTYKRKQRKE